MITCYHFQTCVPHTFNAEERLCNTSRCIDRVACARPLAMQARCLIPLGSRKSHLLSFLDRVIFLRIDHTGALYIEAVGHFRCNRRWKRKTFKRHQVDEAVSGEIQWLRTARDDIPLLLDLLRWKQHCGLADNAKCMAQWDWNNMALYDKKRLYHST